MAPAYKVEELLALRDSVSESAVSLEKFGDEEAIKEHVLRPSVSTSGMSIRPTTSINGLTAQHALRSATSNSGLSVKTTNIPPPATVTNASTGEQEKNAFYSTSAIKKPSPSPSVKRGKAEKLIKEHGSPPGLRVTAGGRIVPTDLSPLSSPKYGYSTMNKPNAPTHLPNSQHLPCSNVVEPSNNYPNGYVGYNNIGQLCQWVDGTAHLLKRINGISQLYMAAPNYPFPLIQPALPQYPQSAPPISFGFPVQAQTSMLGSQPLPNTNGHQSMEAQSIDVATQIQVLEKEYAKMDHERIMFERAEVLQQDALSATARAQMVERKKRYVTELDQIRKSIKELKATKVMSAPAVIPAPQVPFQPAGLAQYPLTQQPQVQPALMGLPFSSMSTATQYNLPSAFTGLGIYQQNNQLLPLPAELAVQQLTQPYVPPTNSLENTQYTAGLPYGAPEAGLPLSATNDNAVQSTSPQGPGTAAGRGRKSHAVEIKKPEDAAAAPAKTKSRTQRSSLDPKSPSYEPGKPMTPDVDSPCTFVPPSPSPIASPPPDETVQAQHPWLFEKDTYDPSSFKPKAVKQKPSRSSVCTADLFPINTHEHSSTRHATSKRDANNGAKRDSALMSDGQPATPEKDWPAGPWNSDLYTPTSDNGYGLRAPPVSPLDARLSSWNRDCNPIYEPADVALGTEPYQQAWPTAVTQGSSRPPASSHDVPVDASVPNRIEKSGTFREGYHAGLKGEAPGNNRTKEFTQGYIQGLTDSVNGEAPVSTPPMGSPLQSRRPSTLSLKSNMLGQPGNDYQDPASIFNALKPSFQENQVPFNPIHDQKYETSSLSYLSLGPTQNSRVWSNGPDAFSEGKGKMTSYMEQRAVSTSGKISLSRQDSGASVSSQPPMAQFGMFPPRSNSGYTTQPDSALPSIPLARQYSGNQIQPYGRRVSSTALQHFSGSKSYQQQAPMKAPSSVAATGGHIAERSFQMDGAMDDLAEMITPMTIAPSSRQHTPSATVSSPSMQMQTSVIAANEGSASPSKSGSPRKTSTSPAKAKLEQIANRVKKPKKDDEQGKAKEATEEDPATMTQDQKKQWKAKWRQRFRDLRTEERREIARYKQENPVE